MDRRRWGTLVVVLALLAALVVPAVVGRRVAGTASRVPVGDPPQIGDCLLAGLDESGSALNFAGVMVAAAPVGLCGDANYGEVVSVTPDWHSFPSTVINRMGNPEPLACQRSARGYMGWDVQVDPAAALPGAGPDSGSVVIGDQGVPGRTLGYWRPVTTEAVGLIGPNLSQYLSGQTWIACVVFPRFAPYSGPVRGGSVGNAAAAYGSCAGVAPQEDSCVQPHVTEIFGVAPGGETDQAVLAASCRDLVVKASGMTDPTAGGALRISVLVGGTFGDSVPSEEPETASDAPVEPGLGQQGQAACVVSVAGDRLLVGSLTGIGDGSLPWA